MTHQMEPSKTTAVKLAIIMKKIVLTFISPAAMLSIRAIAVTWRESAVKQNRLLSHPLNATLAISSKNLVLLVQAVRNHLAIVFV